MKLSDYVVNTIERQGVHHVFEFIGGAITHLIDSLYGREDIQCVSVHHEQAGAFAAEAYARMNGKLGVAMATSGPGALNMMTGVGSCFFDSVPCLFITGQVNTYEYKFDSPIRQIGFQETDIVAVAKPLTKFAEMVVDATRVRYQLEKAIFLAQQGRPGPVLLDIPLNIQRAEIDPEKLESFYEGEEYRNFVQQLPTTQDVSAVVRMIGEARRPMVLVGGGVRCAAASAEFREFVDTVGVPVVASLMGLDAIEHDHPSYVGMIGSYGNRYANLALANCDLLIILGSRLDTRQTGTRPDTFARAAKKIHVDVDPVELNYKVKVDQAILCDVKVFLQEVTAQLRSVNFRADIQPWLEWIAACRNKYPTQSKVLPSANQLEPNRLIEMMSRYCRKGDIICLDVGQHQMWAAQSFQLQQGQRMLISGGMGAMGFALPAAIGGVIAAEDSRGIVIAGDGGIQLNIQELDIVVQRRLPVKIVVFNNGCLGMVRQFQDLYFGGRRQSTVIGYSCPDFGKVAEAYGIPAYQIDSWEDAERIFARVFSDQEPAFVNITLELATEVNPKLVVNRPIEDMLPYLDRRELKEQMWIDVIETVDFDK